MLAIAVLCLHMFYYRVVESTTSLRLYQGCSVSLILEFQKLFRSDNLVFGLHLRCVLYECIALSHSEKLIDEGCCDLLSVRAMNTNTMLKKLAKRKGTSDWSFHRLKLRCGVSWSQTLTGKNDHRVDISSTILVIQYITSILENKSSAATWECLFV